MAEVANAPFVTDFGGFPVVHEKKFGRLVCEEKNVWVLVDSLREAITRINTLPIGHKLLIGKQIRGTEYVHLWRDEFRTHIGCLSEPTPEFSKKLISLIKHLNNK